ncbi:ATP-dependent helicase [uncultured Amnibacterium sp.]|uniref:ATP-dependent helicase n=1 Tax=uncultured Amnibacterium sp. TaxID=1631851 RepID=UPI0035CBC448
MASAAADLLAQLDDQQRAAATALHGPVCVLAGAGTGKTRTIAHRIAYGVATGVYPPKRVLALTFTTRAAGELRARLRGMAVDGIEGVSTRTFHAAALAQLNHFWPQLLSGQVPQLLESKARLVAQAAEVLHLTLDQPVLRDVAAEIEYRKSSALTLQQYAALDRPAPGRLDPDRVLALQELYETLKEERRAIDFEDVLLATAGMIESEPAVAAEVREQYRFLTVDEYQDVSPVQQQLLDAWLGRRDDLCVVGDASQTIYSFAGASPDYLLRFADHHPGAQVLRLERNYRSVPHVLSAANALMAGRRGAIVLRPAAARTEAREAPVTVKRYATEAEEARGIAAEVRAAIDAGTRADGIAVLYRVNSQAAALEAAFADAGLPVTTRGSRRFFEQPAVRQAIMLLRGASVAVSDEPLFATVSDVLREVGHTHTPPPGPGEQRTRWELLDALAALAEQAPAGTTLRAFVADLAERAEAQHEPAVRAVTLATLHAAKGLEWPVVFLAGLAEGLLPIGYATTDEQVDEERRLLYVGITRAQQRLRLSYAAADPHRGQRAPSRFLAELRPAAPATGTGTARARVVRAG